MTMTLAKLYKMIGKALVNEPGIADKTVLLPCDEEGNGYYELLPTLTTDPEHIRACLYVAGYYPDDCNENNCVILG